MWILQAVLLQLYFSFVVGSRFQVSGHENEKQVSLSRKLLMSAVSHMQEQGVLKLHHHDDINSLVCVYVV
jgi:hypothetical protein